MFVLVASYIWSCLLPICLTHTSFSQSSVTPKPKDPPWLALVQSEPKRKPPPPPRPGLGVSQPAGTVPSLKDEGSRPATPPQSTNPFDDDEDEEEELAEEQAESLAPPSVVTNHPWYSITQATEASGTDTPPRRPSPTPSVSPGSGRKKRPAPRPPRPSPTGQLHTLAAVPELKAVGHTRLGCFVLKA